MKSNPTKQDSDGDGFNDKYDIEPLIPNAVEDTIKPLGVVSYTDRVTQHSIPETNVWIATPNNLFDRAKIIAYYNDSEELKDGILILDLSNAEMINYQIYNSYKYSDPVLMEMTLKMLIDYNSSFGDKRSKWKRSVTGLVLEWKEHNLLYYTTFGDIKEQAQHADLDQDAQGTPFNIYYKL